MSLPPDRSEILVPLSLFLPSSTLSSSAPLVLPLLLAGVWLRAQPGRGGGIPLCQDSLLGSSRAWRV